MTVKYNNWCWIYFYYTKPWIYIFFVGNCINFEVLIRIKFDFSKRKRSFWSSGNRKSLKIHIWHYSPKMALLYGPKSRKFSITSVDISYLFELFSNDKNYASAINHHPKLFLHLTFLVKQHNAQSIYLSHSVMFLYEITRQTFSDIKCSFIHKRTTIPPCWSCDAEGTFWISIYSFPNIQPLKIYLKHKIKVKNCLNKILKMNYKSKRNKTFLGNCVVCCVLYACALSFFSVSVVGWY